MSDPHHHNDPIEDNIDTHPVKLAIGIALGAVALIVGIILVAQFAISSYGSRPAKEDPAMRAEFIAERIRPVASVVVDAKRASAPAAPAAPAAAAAPPGAAK